TRSRDARRRHDLARAHGGARQPYKPGPGAPIQSTNRESTASLTYRLRGTGNVWGAVMSTADDTILQSLLTAGAAMRYARRGWHVYPSPKKKGPAFVRWGTEATTDCATIAR